MTIMCQFSNEVIGVSSPKNKGSQFLKLVCMSNLKYICNACTIVIVCSVTLLLFITKVFSWDVAYCEIHPYESYIVYGFPF